METLGKRIGRLRRGRQMTQEELAAKLGVSAQAVSKWENDQSSPDIGLLTELAALLGTTVDGLLTGKEPEPVVKLVPQEQRKSVERMMLRIEVDSAQRDKVRVNLPMALVQAAMDMGLEMKDVAGSGALKSIDLGRILELVNQGVVGNLVEVDSADGDKVRIFVE